MATRLDDVPVVKIKRTAVEAEIFNRLRLAVLRFEAPLRLSLPGLRGIDMMLESQAWICVDRTLYDLPVLAWTNFDIVGRESLHVPIKCQLHYYHVHANVIAETVLSTTHRLIEDRLRPYPETAGTDVVEFLAVKHR